MGQALRGRAEGGGGWRRALILAAALALAVPSDTVNAQAPERLDRGRFTAVFYASERKLATTLLETALAADTFPGLPRPTQRVLLAIAPDQKTFRDWIGPGAPEWGAAITFPESRRVVMQGRDAGAKAGDPQEVWRHELAHLALHEYLGDLPPRWFDEGYASYAAHEWQREDALAANFALALRGTPTFDELDTALSAGASQAQNGYALAYRAVVELAALNSSQGLGPFFASWRDQRSLDKAMRASFGMTLVGYQQYWQQRTRRRYGGLALASNLALGGLVLLLLLVPLYVARRHRDRRRMAELLAADAVAEREARASVLALLLGPEFVETDDKVSGDDNALRDGEARGERG